MKIIFLFLTVVISVFAQNEFRSANSYLGDGIYLREKESTHNEIRYEYKIDTATVTNSDISGYSDVKLGSTSRLRSPGIPQIPYVSHRCIIPNGMKIDSLSLIAKQSETKLLSQPITYAENPVRPGGTITPTEIDDSLYESESLFPAIQSELATVQKKAGVSIAFINLYPIQYRGKNQELITTTSFEITIHLSPDRQIRSDALSSVYPERVNAQMLGIENPDELHRYRSSRSSNSAEVQFLIITGEEFLDALVPYTVNDLAERRRSQGLTTKIVTVDSIYNSTDGIDNPQKIRHFLREAYRDWGVEYVLIAGDTNIVPVRTLSPQWFQYGRNGDPDNYEDSIELFVPSDFYYQCLDGPYNTPYKSSFYNNDGRYWGGKYAGANNELVDLLPELSLGRIPAEKPLEFSNWVTKQFTYEDIPHNDPRQHNVLFAGEYIGFENGMNPDYNIMEYAKTSLEEIRMGGGTCPSYTNLGGTYSTYESASFNDYSNIVIDTLYDNGRGKGNHWRRSDIVEKINSNQYGIIQHLGHGLFDEHMRLKRDNLNVLNNTRPYMIYTQACLSGRFSEDCIAEGLLTDSDTYGIWAGIFNTGFGKAQSNTTDWVVQKMNRQFWEGYFRNENPSVRLGNLNDDSRLALINPNNLNPSIKDRYNFYLYGIYSLSLLGDPTAELKVVRPETQSYLYLTSPTGSDNVSLDVNSKISWHSTESGSVTLSLLASDGSTSEIGTTQSSDHSLLWKPSDFAEAGSGYRMIIKSAILADTSASFSIADKVAPELTNYPTGSIVKGETVEVRWNSDDPSVSVWIVHNGTPVVNLIENSSLKKIRWTIPHSLFSDEGFTVRLMGSNNRESISESEQFSIVAPLVSTFPSIVNFDTLSLGEAVPEGWEQSRVDDHQWLIHSGMTPTKALTNPKAINTGPSFDNTTGAGNYCYVEASVYDSKGKRFDLLTPRYDLRGTSGAKLSFWLHMFAEKADHMGDFTVEMIRENKSDTTLFAKSGRFEDDEWKLQEISLAEGEGEVIQLRFRGVLTPSYASDIAIDDITVSVEDQSVSVLEDNPSSIVISNELLVYPSIVTPEITEVTMYHKDRTPFTFRWSLYDVVGNVLSEGEGEYSGNGSPVDFIDCTSLQKYTGSSVLFLEAVWSDGTKSLYKTYVGFKQ